MVRALRPTPANRRKALKSFSFKGTPYRIPDGFLESFRRKEFDSEVKAKDFTLLALATKQGWGKDGRWMTFYFDAPYNFVLCYKGNAVAVIGFDTADEGSFSMLSSLLGLDESGNPAYAATTPMPDNFPRDTIIVIQLQSTSLNNTALSQDLIQSRREIARKCLAYLRWERLLIQMVVEWAFSKGFMEVRVMSAVKNKWYSSGADPQRLTRMHVRYDVTPRRMGFTPAENGDYCFMRKPE